MKKNIDNNDKEQSIRNFSLNQDFEIAYTDINSFIADMERWLKSLKNTKASAEHLLNSYIEAYEEKNQDGTNIDWVTKKKKMEKIYHKFRDSTKRCWFLRS